MDIKHGCTPTTSNDNKGCLSSHPSQTVNKAILRPVYPIPTLEENLHRFRQAKIFSTFDIKDAFQTIKLTEESSLLTTMHTPWGLYCWTLLPLGISSATEEFQRRIHDVLCCLEGVVNIADDIIKLCLRQHMIMIWFLRCNTTGDKSCYPH